MRLQLAEQQLRSRIRYFAYYELASGIFMIGSILFALPIKAIANAKVLLIYTGFLALGSFVAYCGYSMLNYPQRGLRLSRIGLLAQVVGFSAGSIGFKFFPGFYALFGLNFTDGINFSLNASFSEFYIKLGTNAGWQFALNLIALLLLRYTKKWLREWNYRYTTLDKQPNELY